MKISLKQANISKFCLRHFEAFGELEGALRYFWELGGLEPPLPPLGPPMYSVLWPEATTFLSHRGAYSRPEAVTVACGERPQGFVNQKSRLNPIQMVSLDMQYIIAALGLVQEPGE